jgi:S1-C subfamily serine protease
MSFRKKRNPPRLVRLAALHCKESRCKTSRLQLQVTELGISTKVPGVVITAVAPSSAAEAADLESGDVIQQVNRKPVRNVTEYKQALLGASNQAVLLLVNRAGATRYIVVSAQ